MSDEQNAAPPPPAEPPGDAPPPPPPAGGAPPPPTQSGGASENRTAMIVLAYLWILALVPLLVEKEDAEVQWHAKHGLVLFGCEIVAYVIIGILSSIITCLGCVFYAIVPLVFVVIRILAIVKGIKGERFIIPGVSQFADQF